MVEAAVGDALGIGKANRQRSRPSPSGLSAIRLFICNRNGRRGFRWHFSEGCRQSDKTQRSHEQRGEHDLRLGGLGQDRAHFLVSFPQLMTPTPPSGSFCATQEIQYRSHAEWV